MCLIVFALDCHPTYRLILGANRDEYHDRATEPAGFWVDTPHVMAGRDKQAGGTWLGVTTAGKLAAVTNYRDQSQQVINPPSRGKLVADYLQNTTMTPAEFRQTLAREGASYDGFNLLYGNGENLYYFTNRGGSSGPIKPGIHGLSNHLLDTHWPKVATAITHLESIVQHKYPDPEDIFAALANPDPFAAGQLSDTGIGPERERLLSPLFISGSNYGTRSTTVLLIDRSGGLTFLERQYGPLGAPLSTRCFGFRTASFPSSVNLQAISRNI